MQENQLTEFSFLSAGPVYRAPLPSGLGVATARSAAILLDGQGEREFTLVPKAIGDGDPNAAEFAEYADLHERAVSPDGHSVQIFRRLEPPPLWYIVWDLPDAWLWTHVREEDGLGWATRVVDSVRVAEAAANTTTIVPTGPLSYQASARPGYEELVEFRSNDLTIEFRRPGLIARGTELEDDTAGGNSVLHVGLRENLEVTVVSTDATRPSREVAGAIAAVLG